MLDIQDPIEARKVIRENKYTEQTAGSANKYVQGNLCILPSKYAMDFASFCQKNPKPCPLIGFGTKGDPSLNDLGDIDIRTDVPQYRIWKKGKLILREKRTVYEAGLIPCTPFSLNNLSPSDD